MKNRFCVPKPGESTKTGFSKKERKGWNLERVFLLSWAVCFLWTPPHSGKGGGALHSPQTKWEVLQREHQWLELCHRSLGSQCTGANSGSRKVKGENLMTKLGVVAWGGLSSGPDSSPGAHFREHQKAQESK